MVVVVVVVVAVAVAVVTPEVAVAVVAAALIRFWRLAAFGFRARGAFGLLPGERSASGQGC